MGIDIYMKWRGQTKTEQEAQITGWSVTAGNTGYLREAYHGGPYATQYLVREAFESKTCKAKISAKVLRERLPATVMIALYRDHIVYGESEKDPAVVNADANDDGVIVEMAKAALATRDPTMQEEQALAATLNAEQIRAASHLIESRRLPAVALSFVDFVRLAEAKEKETGQPVTVLASY